MQIIDEIKQEAAKVQNETKPGGNTAKRIGSLFTKIGQALESVANLGTRQELETEFNKKAGKPFSEI